MIENMTLGLTAAACLAGLILSAYSVLRGPPRPREARIFLDIETLGVKPDSPVLVIAAYAVNEHGDYLSSGCWRVSEQSAKHYATSCLITEKWWAERPTAARFAAFTEGPRLSLPAALDGLTDFMAHVAEEYGGRVYVWGNAPSFDCVILRSAYQAAGGKEAPWEFWQERDCRTLAAIGKQVLGVDVKKQVPFVGEPHIALDDARHQAKYTIEILERLKQPRWLQALRRWTGR